MLQKQIKFLPCSIYEIFKFMKKAETTDNGWVPFKELKLI